MELTNLWWHFCDGVFRLWGCTSSGRYLLGRGKTKQEAVAKSSLPQTIVRWERTHGSVMKAYTAIKH